MAFPRWAWIVRLACWLSAAAAAAAPACPEGYFRSSAIVWSCSRSTGISYFFLQPSLKVGVAIPAGVTNFWANASAYFDVDLELFDPMTKTFALKYDTGLSNNRRKSVSYLGTQIQYSGDDTRQIPFHESIRIKGTLERTMLLRFHNEYEKQFITTVVFGYNGIKACPSIPHGCSAYDKVLARQVVEQWSRWVQAKYMTAREAWHALARVKPDGVVHWFMWSSVWGHSAGTRRWQLAFHFMDSNGDGQITLNEFEQGFHFHSWTKAEMFASIAAWREWLCANYGYDRELSWRAFKSATGPIPLAKWQSEVWADWFRSWSRSIKVGADAAFGCLDTDFNGEISRSEFMVNYSSDMCAETKPTEATTDGSRGIGVASSTVGKVSQEAGSYSTPQNRVPDTGDPGLGKTAGSPVDDASIQTSKESSDSSGWSWPWLSGVHLGVNPLAMLMLALSCCLCCGVPLGIFLYSSDALEHFGVRQLAARTVRSRSSTSSDVVSPCTTASKELKLSHVGHPAPHVSSSVPMSLQSGSPMSAANPVWWRRCWPLAPSPPTVKYMSIPSAEEATSAGQAVYKTTSWLSLDGYHTVSRAATAEADKDRSFHMFSPFGSQSTLLPSPTAASVTIPASCSTTPPVLYTPIVSSPRVAGANNGASVKLRSGFVEGSDLELSRRLSPRPFVSGSSGAIAPMVTQQHLRGTLH